jgi:hypothetical protein
MNVTASAGIAPAWTATKPTPADQPVNDNTKAGETRVQTAADKPAERRQPPAPEGQGTRIDIRV